MSLTFVSGDFSSGTTLLFTLLRNSEQTNCLYEPLHERLLHYLVWPGRAYEGHANVGSYFTEYKGMSAIPDLFDPSWGLRDYFLSADDQAPDLHRYLAYIVGSAYGKAPHVVLKENRLTFRLGWLRTQFPHATIVHVHREPERQWNSIVRRVQEYVGREDVGQDSVDFMGFRMATWCDDLAPTFPELARESSSSGYERFSRLHELSLREHRRYADLSMELSEIKDDLDGACRKISAVVGFELDPERLRPLVTGDIVRPPKPRSLFDHAYRIVDRAGLKYADLRVSRRAMRTKKAARHNPPHQ